MDPPPRNPNLTKRQSEIYEFLKDQIGAQGYAPSVREIGDHFQIRSPNGVMCHLKALEKKGLIRREQNMSRAIALTHNGHSRVRIPLLGDAESDSPMTPAVSSDDTVDLGPLLNSGDKAVIRIHGSSFQQLGILDGDCLIIDRSGNGSLESLVVTRNERYHLTLCRNTTSGLVPAIPGSEVATNRQILGTVAGVIRDFN